MVNVIKDLPTGVLYTDGGEGRHYTGIETLTVIANAAITATRTPGGSNWRVETATKAFTQSGTPEQIAARLLELNNGDRPAPVAA